MTTARDVAIDFAHAMTGMNVAALRKVFTSDEQIGDFAPDQRLSGKQSRQLRAKLETTKWGYFVHLARGLSMARWADADAELYFKAISDALLMLPQNEQLPMLKRIDGIKEDITRRLQELAAVGKAANDNAATE